MGENVQWSLKGDYLEACSCDYGCPCKFGAPPTQGGCNGIIGFEIHDGQYGQTNLGGLNMALIMIAPSSPYKGDLTFTLYFDERADDAQRQALTAITSGQAGGFWAVVKTLISDNRGVKFAPMKMETSGNRRTFTIPDVVEIANEPLSNPITGEEEEVLVSNSFDPFCKSGRAGKSVTAFSKDADISFDVSGQQGYTGPFNWAGP